MRRRAQRPRIDKASFCLGHQPFGLGATGYATADSHSTSDPAKHWHSQWHPNTSNFTRAPPPPVLQRAFSNFKRWVNWNIEQFRN